MSSFRLTLVALAALALVVGTAGCASDPPPDQPRGGHQQPPPPPPSGGHAQNPPPPGPGPSQPPPNDGGWRVIEEETETREKGDPEQVVR